MKYYKFLFLLFFYQLNNAYTANLSQLVSANTKVKYMGKTVLTFDGNLGGALGANAKCQVDFPGSHFCNYSEFLKTGESGAIGTLWLAGVGYYHGSTSYRYAMEGCKGWSQNGSTYRTTTTDGTSNCDTSLSLACCK